MGLYQYNYDIESTIHYKKAVLVTGAFEVKDELRGLGGKYNIKLKGWVFPKKKCDAVVTKLQSLEGVDVVDETADAFV